MYRRKKGKPASVNAKHTDLTDLPTPSLQFGRAAFFFSWLALDISPHLCGEVSDIRGC